jgi:hypothetical protein
VTDSGVYREGGENVSRLRWGFRSVSAALLLALALVIAACGVGQQGPSQGGGGGGPTKICMMPKLVGIPYFNAS